MKKILKRVFTPIVLSVIIGCVCGKMTYKIYKDDLENKFSSQKIYLLESGSYVSYENMKENNFSNNYLYYIEDNTYKSIVGITKRYDNIDKIKATTPPKANQIDVRATVLTSIIIADITMIPQAIMHTI